MEGKIKKLCIKCFEDEENCNCNISDFVEIDKNIFSIIQKLNKLGYYTIYCCEGHSCDLVNYIQVYIKFSKDYTFKYKADTEEKYKLILNKSNMLEFYKGRLTINQQEKLKNKYIMFLEEWVETLESI